MIPVNIQPAPTGFLTRVHQPGTAFLAKKPQPNANDWNRHSYWRRILDDLYHAYGGICAYSCHWIPPDTGAKTVEHFKPKSKYPSEAYQWDNYRLVCSTLNGRKGNFEDVLDPFALEANWFLLDFPSLMVYPNGSLTETNARRVMRTIQRLGLNDEGTCLQARLSWVEAYIQVPLPFSYLERNAPFIAAELKRQDLIDTVQFIMGY